MCSMWANQLAKYSSRISAQLWAIIKPTGFIGNRQVLHLNPPHKSGFTFRYCISFISLILWPRTCGPWWILLAILEHCCYFIAGSSAFSTMQIWDDFLNGGGMDCLVKVCPGRSLVLWPYSPIHCSNWPIMGLYDMNHRVARITSVVLIRVPSWIIFMRTILQH